MWGNFLSALAGAVVGYMVRDELFPHDHRPLMEFSLGTIREQTVPVSPTPCFLNRFCIKGGVLMAFQMTDTQHTSVTISGGADKRGNPATFTGVPEWTCDNTDMLAITPAPDGLSCDVAAVGPLGTANVQCKAADDKGNPIFGTLAVTVTGGGATVITLTPGTPVEETP